MFTMLFHYSIAVSGPVAGLIDLRWLLQRSPIPSLAHAASCRNIHPVGELREQGESPASCVVPHLFFLSRLRTLRRSRYSLFFQHLIVITLSAIFIFLRKGPLYFAFAERARHCPADPAEIRIGGAFHCRIFVPASFLVFPAFYFLRFPFTLLGKIEAERSALSRGACCLDKSAMFFYDLSR
jgi:hypothetical protein